MQKQYNIDTMDFEDRKPSPGKENQVKLEIINQTGEEILAKITPADDATIEGTPINASILSQFRSKFLEAQTLAAQANAAALQAQQASQQAETVSQSSKLISTEAKDVALSAKTSAENALDISNQASHTSTLAMESANQAKQDSTEALEKSTEAVNLVASKQGTLVYENGSLQASATFNADTKLDVAQGVSNANKVLTTNQDGNVVSSSIIPVGTCRIYSETDASGKTKLVFEIPD